MPTLFWDASGLAKRYVPESGRPTTLALFAHAPAPQMMTTPWGYTETYALLLRKRNGGGLGPSSFVAMTSALRNDVIINPAFHLLTVTDTDAALLTTFLRYAQASSDNCVLVAADQRLLRAAQVEGLAVINPEILPAADVAAFLASL